MRIGIDIRALMEAKTTGVQVYIINLLDALFKIDHENQYLLFANSFRQVKLPEFDYPNVQTKVSRYANKLFMSGQVFLNQPKVDKLLGGVDLFFSPHWRITALSRDVPLIITFHDLSFEVMPEFFTMRQRVWHKFMNYRGAAQKASTIIAVSRSTKRDLIDLYKIPEDKIKVIYPGSPVIAIRRGGEAISNPGSYFLYFSTFEPRKNIAAVLAAYEEYSKHSLHPKQLILAGSSGWKIKLPREVKTLQNVSEEEKLSLYKNAFALLFLSFYEGFGFPMLEAASLGVPVIASFATSLSEIGQDFALLVNPFRPSQVASAMLELENDNQLYKDLGDKGLEVAKKFNWEKTAEETLTLLESR